jgi:predicted aldo/keto reductase-like oxidoreductase
MERRAFLKMAGVAAGSCTWASKALWAAEPASLSGEADKTPLPRRVLGRTGQQVSTVVFPGLAMTQQEQDLCTAAVRRAVERGVNYFDVAPAYGNGTAEVRLGVALQGIDRSRLFLACKTKMRDKDGARQELERSLQRLRTDHFDLYQMHHIRTPDEVKQALGPGGAIETFLKAREEGKVRFLGFSAHTTKGALEALKGYSFDTIMFPINYIEYLQHGFGRAVVEEAGRQGTAVIGMKALYNGTWPEGAESRHKWWYRSLETEEEIRLALRFTLSQPGVVAAVPPAFVDIADTAVTAARSYQPITEAETGKLRELGAGIESLFRQDEELVAAGLAPHESPYPDNLHGCCPFARC